MDHSSNKLEDRPVTTQPHYAPLSPHEVVEQNRLNRDKQRAESKSRKRDQTDGAQGAQSARAHDRSLS